MPYSPSKTKFGTQPFATTQTQPLSAAAPAPAAAAYGGGGAPAASYDAAAGAGADPYASSGEFARQPTSARHHHHSMSLAAAGAAVAGGGHGHSSSQQFSAAQAAQAAAEAEAEAAAYAEQEHWAQAQASQQPPNWPTVSLLPGKAGLDPLERERREIERRRARFDDRRSRILNAKSRVIGIDKTALEAQVKEKEDQRKKVEAEKNYFDNLTLSHSKLLSEVERERQRVKAAKDEELAFYRKQQELLAKKKKADDRLAGQSNVPAQHPLDATAAAGKPSTVFLDFKGEDLGKAARDADQKRQQQSWLEQQLALQNQKTKAQRAEDADYAAQDKAINDMKKQMEAEAQAARATLRKQTQTYNSLQSAAQKKAAASQQQLDASIKAREIEYTLASDILNEHQSADAHRVNFKGFSSGQRAAIVSDQQRQLQELAAKRAADAQAEADYAAMQDQVNRELIRQDQHKAEVQRQQRLALANTLQHQTKQHHQTQRHLNQVVYTNPVAPAFFDQFGTSHR